MKLSEIKGDAALDALVELIDPAIEIMTDKAVVEAFKSGQKVKAIKGAIKNHKKAVTTILAILDGADPETYKVSVVTLPMKLLEVLNDPDLINLFQLQVENIQPSSTPATGSTEASEK